ncbi:MAG: hypothetical protein VST68_01985 [Nitrospirota bacterium]|nr:hypothetical protein [Nitrospirota bacterium]
MPIAMVHRLAIIFASLLIGHFFSPTFPVWASAIVKLPATADIWLSDANDDERNTAMGMRKQFKLKSIQEMAAIRFDVSLIRGRQVLNAKLFLKPAGQHRIHRMRVSTVNQDWQEGTGRLFSFNSSGATWNRAKSHPHTHWAWKGSHFADVIMTSGNSFATWAALQEESDGWISIALTPDLIYALIAQDSDGLAVADGGNLAYHNNYFFSHEAGKRGPYLQVEMGDRLDTGPETPIVTVETSIERAHLNSSAIKITIQPDPFVFSWRVRWNDVPIPRWRVKHPAPGGPTVFYLEDLRPSETGTLHITAIGRNGKISLPSTISVTTSPALPRPPKLPTFRHPTSEGSTPPYNSLFRVWALPGLMKIAPEQAKPMYRDMGKNERFKQSNAVFDGTHIRLFGGRGEYVSYQLCVENLMNTPLKDIRVFPQVFHGPGETTIQLTDIELYKNWYARNKHQEWQPAYNVPLRSGEPFAIPDPRRGIATQSNQTVYVDVYIPKTAPPGDYDGTIAISVAGSHSLSLPVSLTVYDFTLPDRLSFWTELNSYSVPRKHAQEYFRLAHQHRAVFMPWVIRPKVSGKGKTLTLDFTNYDQLAGPLLSGEAFAKNRRKHVPIRTMYLPFEDSWPTPLNKDTYYYEGYWPKRGDSRKHLTQHYLTAPYIGDALSSAYKEGIHAAQRHFIEHFQEKGWTETEMHAFYGGKNTHRIEYGANMWWTTDEPYHWDDWLALQFFLRHWQTGLQQLPAAHPAQWLGRADISRPQWQGRVLDHLVGPVYFGAGAFRQYRRSRTLVLETGVDLRSYGSLNPDNVSNTATVAVLLNIWLNGGRAHLPWQTLGNDSSLDVNDNVGGNAILVPGERFGHTVIGDMRLKAARDGQQLVEYLELFRSKYNLTREQVQALIYERIRFQTDIKAGAHADNADALTVSGITAWDISELRHALAQMIVQ